eukprot:3935616-Karenia_brevis.AAC.1
MVNDDDDDDEDDDEDNDHEDYDEDDDQDGRPQAVRVCSHPADSPSAYPSTLKRNTLLLLLGAVLAPHTTFSAQGLSRVMEILNTTLPNPPRAPRGRARRGRPTGRPSGPGVVKYLGSGTKAGRMRGRWRERMWGGCEDDGVNEGGEFVRACREWGRSEDDGVNEGGEDSRAIEGTKVGRIRGRGGNEGGEDLKVGRE